MYCPKCAAQNLDDIKYCRACGINLESVALALSEQDPPSTLSEDDEDDPESATNWLEKRREGLTKLVQGGGLLGLSLLVGVALGLFSNQADWIVVWMIFAGWMACWGVITIASAIGALLESKYLLLQVGQSISEHGSVAKAIGADDAKMLPGGLDYRSLSTPPSATEHTTEPLTKPNRTTASPKLMERRK